MKPSSNRSVMWVAGFEALKGVVALVCVAVLLKLQPDNVRKVLELSVRHLHLNPLERHPDLIVSIASGITRRRLHIATHLIGFYALARLAEAYGLFRKQQWARIVGLVSAIAYIPFELLEVVRRPSAIIVVFLAINLWVVWVLWRAKFKSAQVTATGRIAPPATAPPPRW